MKKVFFSLAFLFSSFCFGVSLDWETFKIRPVAPGTVWDDSTSLIFFPRNASRPISKEYRFNIHKSLFGTARAQIIQGRYGQDHALRNADDCIDSNVSGYKICTLPAKVDSFPLSELHIYVENGQNLTGICRLIFNRGSAETYLPDSAFYGAKAWPSHGEELPCTFNPSPLFSVDNDDDGKNVMGTISVGHKCQYTWASFESIITTGPIILLPINASVEISVVAAAPYGQGLTASIQLIPARDSVAGAPQLSLLSIEGKWPLTVKGGYNNQGYEIQDSYKPIQDDLTVPHRYALRISRNQHHLDLKWFIGSAWLSGQVFDENFSYAEETIFFPEKGPLDYYLQLAVDAAQVDSSSKVPVTNESYFNIFDLNVKDANGTSMQHEKPETSSSYGHQSSTEAISLMHLFKARNGYRQGTQERQVYWENQTMSTPQAWTLRVRAIPEVSCDLTDPSTDRCTYASGWIDTYGNWSTGAHPRGMISMKVSVLPATEQGGKNLSPAVWMLPHSYFPLNQKAPTPYPWPTHGEVDIFKGLGDNLDRYTAGLYYGTDAATGWSYMGTEYSTDTFNISKTNQYAVSWDFLGKSPTFSWWVKPAHHNATWQLVREQQVSHRLAPLDKKIDCPALGKHYPAMSQFRADLCFANMFRAGQSSRGLDTLNQSGFYLVMGLAIDGRFNDNPSNDLSGSQMQLEAAHFYAGRIDPRGL